jgi:hypothetical protein
MRSHFWSPWATCALAITVAAPMLASAPAAAEHSHGGKSLAECTAFDQADKGDSAVQFTIHNTCTIPVDCTLSWRLVCAPDSKKRRSTHPSSGAASPTKTEISAGCPFGTAV